MMMSNAGAYEKDGPILILAHTCIRRRARGGDVRRRLLLHRHATKEGWRTTRKSTGEMKKNETRYNARKLAHGRTGRGVTYPTSSHDSFASATALLYSVCTTGQVQPSMSFPASVIEPWNSCSRIVLFTACGLSDSACATWYIHSSAACAPTSSTISLTSILRPSTSAGATCRTTTDVAACFATASLHSAAIDHAFPAASRLRTSPSTVPKIEYFFSAAHPTLPTSAGAAHTATDTSSIPATASFIARTCIASSAPFCSCPLHTLTVLKLRLIRSPLRSSTTPCSARVCCTTSSTYAVCTASTSLPLFSAARNPRRLQYAAVTRFRRVRLPDSVFCFAYTTQPLSEPLESDRAPCVDPPTRDSDRRLRRSLVSHSLSSSSDEYSTDCGMNALYSCSCFVVLSIPLNTLRISDTATMRLSYSPRASSAASVRIAPIWSIANSRRFRGIAMKNTSATDTSRSNANTSTEKMIRYVSAFCTLPLIVDVRRSHIISTSSRMGACSA
eukprot:Rhum_TRINITY_DN15476_c1_g1::Rhum_TRINITY_DN15476_c1_g1_i5::g.160086::m.160086